jgi:large subunit ribosomal protein L19
VSQELLRKAAEPSVKPEIPEFRIGDTVNVAVRIVEGEKERIQLFTGTVIARKGSGMSETFTVRRIVNNQGVERVFPIHSPKVAGVEVVRSGKVRRAKLYYLRDRIGKATRLKEVKRVKVPKTDQLGPDQPEQDQVDRPVEPSEQAEVEDDSQAKSED